jgi:hypothetical protein
VFATELCIRFILTNFRREIVFVAGSDGDEEGGGAAQGGGLQKGGTEVGASNFFLSFLKLFKQFLKNEKLHNRQG